MYNWLEYIDSKFSDYESLNVHKNNNGFYPYRLYKINGIYISFEFDGLERIRKVECGSYFSEDDFECINSVKAVLDKTQEKNLRFIQTSYDGENGKHFELTFNNENKVILDTFLKLPIEEGWTENYFKYRVGTYKVKVELKNIVKSFEIILLDKTEQDFPLFGDKVSRKIDAFLIDNFSRKKHILVEKLTVKSL